MILSLKNNDFVKIKDEYGKIYYGGNQEWFEKKIARGSACGTVCAANICSYLAMSDSKYSYLYKYDENLGKNYFLRHMNDVYKFLKPIVLFKLPKFFRNRKLLGFYIEDYLSLGIPSAPYFVKGLEKFAKSRGVNLQSIVFDKPWSRAKAREFIREALEKDKPIALLNLFNNKLGRVETVGSNGESYFASYEHHWVCITGMSIHKNTGKVYIKVSSWSCEAVLDLDDVVSGFSKMMLYFE